MIDERFLHPLLPVHGRLNRPRVRQMTVPHAGPGPLLTALHQPGPYRIAQDIAEHREEMGVLLDGKTFEAALPDMAVTPVMPMVAPHMTGQPPLHEGTQGPVSRRLKHQMEMVGHQTKPEHLHGVFGLGRGKQVEEGAIVSLLVKHDGAAIAAIEDMVGVPSTLTAGNARHQDGTLRQVHGRRQEKSSLSPFLLLLSNLASQSLLAQWRAITRIPPKMMFQTVIRTKLAVKDGATTLARQMDECWSTTQNSTQLMM